MDNKDMITQDLTEKELLEELVSLQKKNSVRSTVTMAAVCIITVVIIVVSVITVPKIVNTFNNADKAVSSINTLIDSANEILNDNSQGVSEALDKISSIDIDSLNDSISSLSNILKPLASLFGSSN